MSHRDTEMNEHRATSKERRFCLAAGRWSPVALLALCLCVSVANPLSAAQFARPASDVAAGSYTPTPLWQQLDEAIADDDLTAVDSSNNPGEADGTGFEILLSALTDPQSSTGHTLRLRGRRNGGGRTITINFRLYQGATPITAAQSFSDGADTYTTKTYTLLAAEADAITDYSNLRVRVWSTTAGGGPASKARVTWIELEAPDAPPPAARNRAVIISRRHPLPLSFRTRLSRAKSRDARPGGEDSASSHRRLWSQGGPLPNVSFRTLARLGGEESAFLF